MAFAGSNALPTLFRDFAEPVPRILAQLKRIDTVHVGPIEEVHLAETEGHVERLERILQELGQPARGKRCKGMEGLLEEALAQLSDEHRAVTCFLYQESPKLESAQLDLVLREPRAQPVLTGD